MVFLLLKQILSWFSLSSLLLCKILVNCKAMQMKPIKQYFCVVLLNMLSTASWLQFLVFLGTQGGENTATCDHSNEHCKVTLKTACMVLFGPNKIKFRFHHRHYHCHHHHYHRHHYHRHHYHCHHHHYHHHHHRHHHRQLQKCERSGKEYGSLPVV